MESHIKSYFLSGKTDINNVLSNLFVLFYEAKETSMVYCFWWLYITETGLYLFFSVLMLASILILFFSSCCCFFLQKKNRTGGKNFTTLSLTLLKPTCTAWRVAMLHIGMKGTVTSRHQDLNPRFHSHFCLCFLFQRFNSLFYKTVDFLRQSDRHFLDKSRK